MFLDTRDKLSTKEAAAFLNIAIPTVHKYVKDKWIKPAYEDWQQDGTMLFYIDDLKNLRELIKKPKGYTVSELAKELGTTSSRVLQSIYNGRLKAEKHIYRGKETYFINHTDAEVYLKDNNLKVKEQKNYSIVINNAEYYLYQQLIQSKTNRKARVVEIVDGKVLTEDNDYITIQDALNKGYVVDGAIKRGKIISAKGHVKLEFSIPKKIDSTFFNIIDWIYQYITPSNMNISISNDKVVIKIKPASIPIDSMKYKKEIKFLIGHIIEGKIIIQDNKLILKSDWESVTFYLHDNEKKQLKNLAKQKSTTLEELCRAILLENLKNE